MVPGDSALEASELVSKDPRFALQAWDAQRTLGEVFQQTLKLKCPAWDVYLVYAPGQTWEADLPPEPKLWMHQLGSYSGADPKLHLDAKKLKAYAKSL